MPNSKRIIYLSEAQRQELFANDTITVNGVTIDYNENDIYITPQSAPVTDVQVNGTSVVSGGVAEIPVATSSVPGVIKLSNGITTNNGNLVLVNPTDTEYKTGGTNIKAVVPSQQHKSTFYGLAAAAGDSTQSASNNAVGTYTSDAKAAIQNMIGTGDVVLVQSTQPTATTNKIWINNSTQQTISVPTVAEMNAGLAGKLNSDAGITGATAGQVLQIATVNASGKPTSYSAVSVQQTLTVTCVTQDNTTVTGQTVTVREGGANGHVFATAAYNGQPVSFAIPRGFSYHVSVSDTLAHHFNPTTASGIINNADASVTLTYSDFSNISTAADIKAALDADIDLTDLVGEQITCTKGSDTLTWDIVDYGGLENPYIVLLLHNAFGSSNMVFEPSQALMYCDNGLAAGDYKFKVGTTYYYFTLATAIPNGGQLCASDGGTFTTYASQSTTAVLETGTVSTTEIMNATDLGTAGEGNLNHNSRVRYGSNNYAESALHWWLNSDSAENTLREPVTVFSRAYSYNVPGFMNGLDANFVAALDEVNWPCSANNTYECPSTRGGSTTKGISYSVQGYFALPSEMEIFGSYGGVSDGSTIFDYYNGATSDDRKKYRNTSAQTWWLRSPGWSHATSERCVGSSGVASYNSANVSYAVVPACKISKTTEESAITP